MKLFIPCCGTRIALSKPWTFRLHYEGRNVDALKAFGIVTEPYENWSDMYVDTDTGIRELRSFEHTLPVGSLLEVDRVYIRQHAKQAMNESEDFDSITFKLIPIEKKGKVIRFWVKLVDANAIEYAIPIDATLTKPRGMKKFSLDRFRNELRYAGYLSTCMLSSKDTRVRDEIEYLSRKIKWLDRDLAEAAAALDVEYKKFYTTMFWSHADLRNRFLDSMHQAPCKHERLPDGSRQRTFAKLNDGFVLIAYTDTDDTEASLRVEVKRLPSGRSAAENE